MATLSMSDHTGRVDEIKELAERDEVGKNPCIIVRQQPGGVLVILFSLKAGTPSNGELTSHRLLIGLAAALEPAQEMSTISSSGH